FAVLEVIGRAGYVDGRTGRRPRAHGPGPVRDGTAIATAPELLADAVAQVENPADEFPLERVSGSQRAIRALIRVADPEGVSEQLAELWRDRSLDFARVDDEYAPRLQPILDTAQKSVSVALAPFGLQIRRRHDDQEQRRSTQGTEDLGGNRVIAIELGVDVGA